MWMSVCVCVCVCVWCVRETDRQTERMLMSLQASFGGDENILELNNGDGGTIL